MELSPLNVSPAVLRAFSARWGVSELALFGSSVRDDFASESDVDVLVSFDESARPTLFDLERMEDELEKIFGRDVDLVERKAIEESHNWIRRRDILSSARPLYPASR